MHPQEVAVIRRDEVAEVDLGTALIRANNDGAAVNGLQRNKKSNELQRPTAADENCVNEIFSSKRSKSQQAAVDGCANIGCGRRLCGC